MLGRWAGWGSIPQVFDAADSSWDELRHRLTQLWDDHDWAAARRSVINAHFTSAEVVTAMWRLAVGLGFAGGRVLEPGCGSGNFLALAPAEVPAEYVGVELDPTTARIAAALHPQTDIRNEGFEATRLPEASVDLVIGNVPFGTHAPYDPRHNAGRHSIHNYFVLKSLRLTRPGGLVVVITSRFTMDARNPAARREMAELADLVGALRLPAGAFRAAAGTDAVTDLLVLRRRQNDQPAAGSEWSELARVAVADGEVELNRFFATRPDTVLGELCCGGGQYRADDLDVRAGKRPLPLVLEEAIAALVERATAAGLRWLPADSRGPEPALHPIPTLDAWPEGSIIERDGGFARIADGVASPLT
ncbi:MAG: methyltransferase domain-containing protein, partial [Acidimicrobiales bacterium]